MKTKIKLLSRLSALSVISALLASVSALGALPETKKELLDDIKEETKKCTVQTIATKGNDRKVTSYRSTCPTLRLIAQDTAQIFIDGEWFTVKIKESVLSDGGDLDDLFVFNAKGAVVARRTNIAAYDNIVVAMAGTTELQNK